MIRAHLRRNLPSTSLPEDARSPRPTRFPWLWALGLAACGGGKGDTGPVDDGNVCVNETRADTFETGMVLDSEDGAWSITFIRADPAPPEKGDNRWVLGLTAADGSAPTDAHLSVEPEMPDHGHGTNPSEFVAIWDDDASAYVIDDLYLTMAGYWAFTFSVTAAGETEPSLAGVKLCLES
jgi:hypothetical protein